jgi:RHS repeat-associated protein
VAATAHDAANLLTQWGASTLTYDLDGNLTHDGTQTYTWNARDQLVALPAATFEYDAVGRRQRRVVGGTTTDFVYDGLTPVQEQDGTQVVAAQLTGLGIDECLGRTDAAGTRYLLPDALGSTLALTDPAGAVQTEYTYAPFGATTASGPSSSNPHQFTGRENDGTGLYYYRARYYSPTLGRFVSEDPIEFLAGDLNLYVYVASSPLAQSDPLGLCPLCAGIAGGAVAGGVAGAIGAIISAGPNVTLGDVGRGIATGAVIGGLTGACATVACAGMVGAAGGLVPLRFSQWAPNPCGFPYPPPTCGPPSQSKSAK